MVTQMNKMQYSYLIIGFIKFNLSKFERGIYEFTRKRRIYSEKEKK